MTMNFASRALIVATMAAVSSASLACTKNYAVTKMPKGTTINTILNGPNTATNPYAGFFAGFQNEIFSGAYTGTAAVDPTTGIPLMTELGLDGSATTGLWTVTVVPDAYMPAFGGSYAFYTTAVNQTTVQQMVASYAVIPGSNSYNTDDGVIKARKTLGGYNIFGLHTCNGTLPASLTLNNANVLAVYKVDNGIVYVVDGISVPKI
jgi:hypothetical protein